MPAPCACCAHPERKALNKRVLAGDADTAIAGQYGMSSSSVRRHRLRHLAFSPQAESEAHNVRTIVGFASDLHRRALKVLDQAEAMLADQDVGSRGVLAAAASLREVRSSIELLAKLIVNEPQGESSSSRDAALDQRIGAALAAITLPALGPGADDIADAEVVA